MSDYKPAPEGKDPQLWEIAQKRADFKSHLISYIIVNGFFWALWFFTGNDVQEEEYFPWPIWPMLGWGIGLAFHFADAYFFPRANSIEKEYQKLKNQQ